MLDNITHRDKSAHMVKQLKTVEEVISALGGPGAVRELTGRYSASVVPMWKSRQSFPPNTFLLMKAALRAKGVDAPAALWNMAEAS